MSLIWLKARGWMGRLAVNSYIPGQVTEDPVFLRIPWALLRIAQEVGFSDMVVEAGVEANNSQKARMVKKIRDALGGCEAGKTIGVLGLTFKPETDDFRDAPALSILPPLLEKRAKIQVHDPQGMEKARKIFPNFIYVKNSYEAAVNADALVLMTEWNQYRALDLERNRLAMKTQIFIDLRNVYDPIKIKEAGFQYFGVGRN
jgi:UDPglucose 6-dehydrogenase